MNDLALDRVLRGVKTATSLTSLELDGCDVSTNGALLIAVVIRSHRSLKTLSLNADPYRRPLISIGCVGTVAIMRALCSPRARLTSLR
jgi:hypothetical protein